MAIHILRRTPGVFCAVLHASGAINEMLNGPPCTRQCGPGDWHMAAGCCWKAGATTRVVLTGSPCQTFPRPRPEEGPEPSAELLLVAIHLSARQIYIIDIIM